MKSGILRLPHLVFDHTASIGYSLTIVIGVGLPYQMNEEKKRHSCNVTQHSFYFQITRMMLRSMRSQKSTYTNSQKQRPNDWDKNKSIGFWKHQPKHRYIEIKYWEDDEKKYRMRTRLIVNGE